MKDEVCFVTVVVWDKMAETANQYLRKGSPVFIEGRLQSRSWEAADGTKRNVLEVRAERVQFLGGAQVKPSAAAPVDAAAHEESTESAWLSEESEGKINEG
jgi:single-strand DNA-binding protein